MLLAATSGFCAEPLVGSAVASERHQISIGEALTGTTGPIGQLHITSGRVQGILELTATSAPGIEIGKSVEVTVYPNPTSQMLNIRRNTSDAASLSIVSASGAMMLSATLSSESETVDLQNFPAGIYILNVTADDNLLYTTKVIKR